MTDDFLKSILWDMVIPGSQLSLCPTSGLSLPLERLNSIPRAQVHGRHGEGVTGFLFLFFFLRTRELEKQCLDLLKGAGRPARALQKRAAGGDLVLGSPASLYASRRLGEGQAGDSARA